MTRLKPMPSSFHSPSSNNTEALQARVAMRIASVLNDGARALPHDITERLRFAREKAVAHARTVAAAAVAPAAVQVSGDGSAALALGGRPDGAPGWWRFAASLLPLAALVGGLVAIQTVHLSSLISATAEVDAELLADELPPTAYADPGFVEYLKTPDN